MENSYINRIKDGIVEISEETLTYKSLLDIYVEDVPRDILRAYVNSEIDNLIRVNNAKNVLPKPNSILSLIDFKKGLTNNDIKISYLDDETIGRLAVKLKNTIERFKFEYETIKTELNKTKNTVLGSKEVDVIFDLELLPKVKLYKDIIESANLDMLIGDITDEEYELIRTNLESAIGVTAFTTNFQELDKSVLPEIVIKVKELLSEFEPRTLEEIVVTLSELIIDPKEALKTMTNSYGFKYYLKIAGNLMFYLLYKITLHADENITKAVKKYMRKLMIAIESIVTENEEQGYILIDVRKDFDPVDNNLTFKIITDNNIIRDLGVTKPVIIGYIITMLGLLNLTNNLLDDGSYSIKLYKKLIIKNKDTYVERYKNLLNNIVEVYRLKKANTLRLSLVRTTEKIVNEINNRYNINVDPSSVASDVKTYLDKVSLTKLTNKTNEVIDEVINIILNRVDPAAAYFKQILEEVSDKTPNMKKAIILYFIKYLVNQLQPVQ